VSTPRFVIGSFDDLEDAIRAVEDLRRHNLPREAINVLGAERTLVECTRLSALAGEPRALFDLKPPEGRIVCLGQGLGDALRAQINESPTNLEQAFGRWLLPGHARALGAVIARDGLLAWIEVRTAEEERAASLSLLSSSRGTVEVHDLVAVPA
jgi:hypothetical protein